MPKTPDAFNSRPGIPPHVGESLRPGVKGHLLRVDENNFLAIFGASRFESMDARGRASRRRGENAFYVDQDAVIFPAERPSLSDTHVIAVASGRKPGFYTIEPVGVLSLIVQPDKETVVVESENRSGSGEVKKSQETLYLKYLKALGLDLSSAGGFTELGVLAAEQLWSILQRQRSEALDS